MKQQVIFVCYFTLLKNLYGYVITQGQLNEGNFLNLLQKEGGYLGKGGGFQPWRKLWA